jgi:hypothetical protein
MNFEECWENYRVMDGTVDSITLHFIKAIAERFFVAGRKYELDQTNDKLKELIYNIDKRIAK